MGLSFSKPNCSGMRELYRETKSNKAKAVTESGRGDNKKRGNEDVAVNSGTLGNEKAVLVMKWNDRESLGGLREGDGENSRSWSHEGDERYFSQAGTLYLFFVWILSFFGCFFWFWYGTQETHDIRHLFRPTVVPLFALNLNQRLVIIYYFNYCCSLCQHGGIMLLV